MASLLQKPVCDAVNALLQGKDRISVLEAGCGSASQITFAPAMRAVGIDISADQLEKNTAVQEKILGDIQDYPLPPGEFDVAVCWMVLEHLPRPKDALANMFRAVKPGGLVILAVPNLTSIKGIVTRFTPFWFHELFYRYMRHTSRHFPTYLRREILPHRMISFARENGLAAAFCRLSEGGVSKKLRDRSAPINLVFSTLDRAARVLSFGKWQTALLDECAIVLRKNDGQHGTGLAAIQNSTGELILDRN